MWKRIKSWFKKKPKPQTVKTQHDAAMDWISRERVEHPNHFKPVSPAGERSRRLREIALSGVDREQEKSVQLSDEPNTGLLNTIVAAEIVSSIDRSPTVDSSPSCDPGPSAYTSSSFGGFDGGSSGGGGASGDW